MKNQFEEHFKNLLKENDTAEVCHVKGLLLSQAEIVHLRGVVRQDGVT
jgi:hypothetical protein